MPRHYTLSTVLHGEDVEVTIAVGPAEPPGTPFAGERDVDVISVRALSDGEDLIDHADELDLSELVERALGWEQDMIDAAAEDAWEDERRDNRG